MITIPKSSIPDCDGFVKFLFDQGVFAVEVIEGDAENYFVNGSDSNQQDEFGGHKILDDSDQLLIEDYLSQYTTSQEAEATEKAALQGEVNALKSTITDMEGSMEAMDMTMMDMTMLILFLLEGQP